MPDDPDAWAAALGLEPDRAAAFARLAADMGLNAPALLRVMIARVAEADRDMPAIASEASETGRRSTPAAAARRPGLSQITCSAACRSTSVRPSSCGRLTCRFPGAPKNVGQR